MKTLSERMREEFTNTTPGRWKSWGMMLGADQSIGGSSSLDDAVWVVTGHQQVNGRPRTGDINFIQFVQNHWEEIVAAVEKAEKLTEAVLGHGGQ